MAVKMPGATWRPLSYGVGAKRDKTDAVIFHVADSNTTSLHGMFNHSRTKASCHLYVRKDGTCEQYADLGRVTWTSGDGNGRSIGVETQGRDGEPWTDAQLKACAAIARFVCDHYDLPVRLMKSSRPSEKGIGYHRLGVRGNFPAYPSVQAGVNQRKAALGGTHESWSGVIKTCPGNERVAQMPRLVELAAGEAGPLPQPAPITLETLPTLSYGDIGKAVKVLQTALGITADAQFGANTRAAVEAFQQTHGLMADGIFGPNTKAALVAASKKPKPEPEPAKEIPPMGKRLYSGNPNGGVLGTRTSYAQLKACAEELDRLGFMVRENLHFGDKVLDRNAHSSNSLHYCHSGTGAIDVNWPTGGRDELIMISAYAIPIARKHGLKGAVHRPRRALLGTHNTWIHIDRSGWWDANGISLSSSDKARARQLAGAAGSSSARSGSSSLAEYPRYGDEGKYVKDLQKKLWAVGYSKVLGKIDSSFGNATKKALGAYQKREGLKVDYIAGPNTWKHLNADVKALINKSKKKSNPNPNRGLKVDGIFGPDSVKALQRTIGAKVDGSLGPSTVRRWQQVLGTKVDGKISDPSTLISAVQAYMNKVTKPGLKVDGYWGDGSRTTRALQDYLRRGGMWTGAPGKK